MSETASGTAQTGQESGIQSVPGTQGTTQAHTPGPWDLMAGIPTNVLSSHGLRVARCDFDGDMDHPEALANARLIAAAPDLLGALRFVLAFYEPGQSHLDTEAWKVAEAGARRAVAKAEGR